MLPTNSRSRQGGPYMDDAPDFSEEPLYSLGLIIGRMHAVNELMARFAEGDAPTHDPAWQLRDIIHRQESLANWLDQAKAEVDADYELLMNELKSAEQVE